MTYEADLTFLRAALIKLALLDALGNNPTHAEQAKAWLERNGYAHLLSHPGATQFTPEARRRKPKRASAPQPMENHV